MSNEPENRVADPRVTENYRDLARERAPEHLNQRVLKMSAGGRTPYGRARAWMRPAAWAATIGLSLAIVLELTLLPSLDENAVVISPATESDSSIDRQTSEEVAVPRAAPSAAVPEKVRTPVETERKRTGPQPRESVDMPFKEGIAARATAVRREAEDLARAQAGSENRADTLSAGRTAADPEVEIAELMSMEPARMQREQADTRAAQKVAEEAGNAAALLARSGDAMPSATACLPSQREAPGSWLDCIRDLRERGLEQQADEEYEEFQRLFPEFEDSSTDK